MDSWIVVEWELDVQNTLKDVALPVHLLRQVFSDTRLVDSQIDTFSTFLASFSRRRFCIVFESIFERFWKGFGSQHGANIDAKSS